MENHECTTKHIKNYMNPEKLLKNYKLKLKNINIETKCIKCIFVVIRLIFIAVNRQKKIVNAKTLVQKLSIRPIK